MTDSPRWLAQHGQMAVELAMATLAAGVAIYVRGLPTDGTPRPPLRNRLISSAAEAVVCGFFAGGTSAFFGWNDQRVTYAIAAALAYVGVAFLRDMFQRIASRKADTL